MQRLGPAASIFVRASHASGAVTSIATSIGWGVVADPLPSRRPFDQVGIGFAWNQTNREAIGEPARGPEFVAEAYYNCATFRGLKIGPDLQFYPEPALAPLSGPRAVVTLRCTATF